MRGALRLSPSPRRSGRIIPAYAGSTVCAWVSSFSAKDHPRVCGEHQARIVQTPPSAGSSPRMRGAPAGQKHGAKREGIIPAYAGSTSAVSPQWSASGDHPRVCGEHIILGFTPSCYPGSSPRMRGAQAAEITVTPQTRIIPAYAGSTGSRDHCDPTDADHPRVCGEHSSSDAGT